MYIIVVVVQLLSCVWLLCHPMDCSLPGLSDHGDSPGKNIRVGCHFLLQRIFLTQGSNPGLAHCWQTLYRLRDHDKKYICFDRKSSEFCCCSVTQLCPTLCNPMDCSTPGFPGGSEVKASVCNARDLGSIPGSGRSPGEGNGNSLWYSCRRIPWTEGPGGLQSMELQRVGHN